MFADIGLGKTRIALRALRSRKDWTRCLVVAPTAVAHATWTQEAVRWRDLVDLPMQVAAGKPPGWRNSCYKTAPKGAVVVINYELLHRDIDTIRTYFDAVIFDESDKMKTPGSARFKAFRKWVASFRIRWCLTGTPASEGLEELWTQAYIAKPGVLGTSFTRWKQDNFRPTDYQGYNWQPLPGVFEKTLNTLAPFTIRLDRKDHLTELPERIEKDIEVELPPAVMKKYRELEKNAVMENSHEALERASVMNKLRQMANGFLYSDEGTQWLHEAKHEVLADLLEELRHEQVLIGYYYTATAHKLAIPYIGGDSKWPKEVLAKDWNEKKIHRMGIQPQSGGHGLNLQLGGAHNLIWMTLPWSRREYDQTCGRLDRMGQKNVVLIQRIYAKDTVEEDVIKALKSKGDFEKSVLDGMKERNR